MWVKRARWQVVFSGNSERNSSPVRNSVVTRWGTEGGILHFIRLWDYVTVKLKIFCFSLSGEVLELMTGVLTTSCQRHCDQFTLLLPLPPNSCFTEINVIFLLTLCSKNSLYL